MDSQLTFARLETDDVVEGLRIKPGVTALLESIPTPYGWEVLLRFKRNALEVPPVKFRGTLAMPVLPTSNTLYLCTSTDDDIVIVLHSNALIVIEEGKPVSKAGILEAVMGIRELSGIVTYLFLEPDSSLEPDELGPL